MRTRPPLSARMSRSFRLQAFVLGSMAMGLSGALTAHAFKFIGPDATLPLVTTFLVWVMLIAGGSANNRGAISGADRHLDLVVGDRAPHRHACRPNGRSAAAICASSSSACCLQVVLQRFPHGLLPERPPRPPEAEAPQAEGA